MSLDIRNDFPICWPPTDYSGGSTFENRHVTARPAGPRGMVNTTGAWDIFHGSCRPTPYPSPVLRPHIHKKKSPKIFNQPLVFLLLSEIIVKVQTVLLFSSTCSFIRTRLITSRKTKRS